jgi:chromosome partitioning protein
VRTLAVTNQKGGSGKTTSAVNLAAALGEKGKRVLVVDLDPQASASAWLGVKDGGRGLLEVFTEGAKLAPLVQGSSAPGVDVVASSTWLVGVEALEAGQTKAEAVFRRALAALPDRWDFVLVDCPPSLGVLSLSALAACREVLVTVEATALALAGLAGLLQTVERVRDRLNPELTVSAILVCRFSTRRNLSRDVVDRLRERFGPLVLEAVVRDSARLAEAWSFSKPVTLYAPTSPGAEDYRAAAAELLNRKKRRANP